MKTFSKIIGVALVLVIVITLISLASKAEAQTYIDEGVIIAENYERLIRIEKLLEENNAKLTRIESFIKENKPLFKYLRCKEKFFKLTISDYVRYDDEAKEECHAEYKKD